MKQNAFVEIPRTTLNALKNVLFDQSGTNLTNIINDLSIGENNDLVAINVGLAFKGITPEIDKTTRYDFNYCRVYRYEFESYSLILNKVRAKMFVLQFNKEDNTFAQEWKEESYRIFMLEDWLNFAIDESEQKQKVINNYGKKA